MQVTNITDANVLVTLSYDELDFLWMAFNETVNANRSFVSEAEFQKRVGCSRDKAKSLLEYFLEIRNSVPKALQSEGKNIQITLDELVCSHNVIVETLKDIGDWEFTIRIPWELDKAEQMEKEFRDVIAINSL